METVYKKRTTRYTDNEIHLITLLITNRVDFDLWNGDTVRINQDRSLLTRICNEHGEEVLYIFNHIEYEWIEKELKKLMG